MRGACTDLAALCAAGSGQCRYSVTNGGKRECCPTGAAGPTPPPPTRPVGSADSELGFKSLNLPLLVSVGTSPPSGSAMPALNEQELQFQLVPPAFPNMECERDATLSRYSLSEAMLSPVPDSEDAVTRVCFTVDSRGASDCPASSSCCSFPLQKVELEVSETCHGALAYTSVGGVPRPPFFQLLSGAASVIKVVNLEVPEEAVGGTEVCLFLRSQCSTLEQLCGRGDGRCAYSLLGESRKGVQCCPVGLAGTSGREAGALAR